MESEERLMETEQHWMLSASEIYVTDSDMERNKMGSASASGVHLMEKEKHQEGRGTKRYTMDSDSEPHGVDSDSERHELASAAVKCLMDNKTFQLSTDTEGCWVDSWSERCTMDLDSESRGMASDSGKHMMKAESCQSASDLERFWMGTSFESERCWTDSERQQLYFNYVRCWDSSRFQYRSARLQGSSGKCQVDLQKHRDNFERHKINSDSKTYRANYENERYQNKFHSERHMMEMEREQCLIQFETERLQKDEEREKYVIEADSEKDEALRLGARKKGNRPQGFWRPIFLSPPLGQGKSTEENCPVQQTGNRVSRIQLVRYLSDEKFLRFREASPTLSDKQDSQQKLKEKHSHNLSPDPNTLVDKKHQRNASHKISVYESCCKDYRHQQSFQSSGSQINPVHLLSAEDYTSEVSVPVCHPTSMSTVQPKTHRNNTYSLDTGATMCSKYFIEISNSNFHKCLMDSDDSHPDNPLHRQIPMDSKYGLSPKPIRHRKTSRNSPLSRSLDPMHPVGIRCPLHQEDSKYSFGSTSYLNCESCSALQSLIGFTVTSTFPMNPQNTMVHLSTPGPDNIISSNIAGLESEGKLNLTVKLENETSLDNETKLVSTGNLKDKANDKDKSLLKDETDHEDETDSDEKDPDDETNTKDKKDPKDKSDPDDSDTKDSNAENDADTSNGSDPSGDADPTSGTDSNSDGDSNNGSDSNSEPDSNIDNVTNNDSNSKYSSDSEEEKYTNNSDNASADPNNNKPGLTINESSLQNNGPCPQNNGHGPNIPISSNNGSGLNINGLGPNNSPVPNSNSPNSNNNGPGPNNSIPDLKKDPNYNCNARPSNTTSHNSAISSNKDADSNYDTKPVSTAGHNYAAAPNYDSDLDYVPRFTHAVGYSFVVNTNYIANSSYAARPSSTISNLSDAIIPSYIACIYYASDSNHDTRFTHVIGSNFVTNPNYKSISILNVHNSSTSNINLSEPELEISSSSSIPNIVYDGTPTFSASTNYTSIPGNLTTTKFSASPKLCRNYIIIDDHKFGVYLKGNAGSIDSASFRHAIESKDVLDAKESGLLKDFSRVQNPIGIKDPASLNFHSNSHILLPSFAITLEAEPSDVVKFTISSGAVNHFFKVSL
uniref:Uncharacterized protein n=1 Tax=Rhinolophus ferrumequinum TaxID=59479 RepID=A0A671EAD5_RHIFE